jgi:hypothetical protein
MSKLNVNVEQDYFAVLSHPEVVREIKVMACQVSKVPGSFKREILISFLKNHSINIDWLVGNDELVQMVTSGPLKMYRTERLFELRRSNKIFIADLEGYIETELANSQYNFKHRNVLTGLSCVEPLEHQRYHACASTLAGKQKSFGIHEEEISKLADRFKNKILTSLEIKKKVKRIIRALSVRTLGITLFS